MMFQRELLGEYLFLPPRLRYIPIFGTDGNEKLCAMEPCTVEKISPRAGLESGTARSEGQRLTHSATGVCDCL